MDSEIKVNQAEKLINTPVRTSIAVVAIALMLSLAINATVTTVYSAKVDLLQQAAVSKALKVDKGNSKDSGPSVSAAKFGSRIIVKYKEGAKLPSGLTVAAERANLEQAQGLMKVLTIAGIDADVYEVSDEDTAQEVVDYLRHKKSDLIEYAEVDMLVAPDYLPNDPKVGTSWHINKVGAPTAWDTTKGNGIIIAIADTGVDCTHPDLASRCVPGWNTVSNNNDTTDVYGHGTKVAGVAAQTGDNALGSAGIAYEAQIMPMRITNDPSGYAYYSAIASAFIWAADNGAKVANASYAACGSASVINAANYLRTKGGVAVLSAGNTGANSTAAQSSSLTCVSGTASNDVKASWSSFGQSIDVAAPGASIYTTVKGGGYGSVSGTSFSAPLTAGIYALIFATNPVLTPAEADNILFSTALDLGTTGWDTYYGHGRVNAAAAVAAALPEAEEEDPVDTVAPSIPNNLHTTSITSDSADLAWDASTDDSSGVAGYAVYRDGAKLTTVVGTSYTDSGLNPNTSYEYSVTAEDVAGNVSSASVIMAVVTPDVILDTPLEISSYSTTNKTSSGITVLATLTESGSVIVKYGTNSSDLNLAASSTVSGVDHSVPLTGLQANTTYYYQVVAAEGSTTVNSSISSFKTSRAGRGDGGGKPRR